MYENSTTKIRVTGALTEPLSRQLAVCREKGLRDSIVVESALSDYFQNIGVAAAYREENTLRETEEVF